MTPGIKWCPCPFRLNQSYYHRQKKRGREGLTRARPYSLAISLFELSTSQRAAQQLPGACTGVLVVAQDDLAVDYGGHEARGLLLQAPRARWQVVVEMRHQRSDRIGIEYDGIGGVTLAQQSAPGQAPLVCRDEAQHPHRIFQRHRLLLAHP